MRLLTRLRTDLGIPEGDKVAFITRRLARPNRFHRPDVIIGDFSPELSVDPENFVFPRLDASRASRCQGRCPAGRRRTHRGMQFASRRAADSARHHQAGNPEVHRPHESGKIGKRGHRFVKVRTVAGIRIFGSRRDVSAVNLLSPREVVVNVYG